MASLILLIKLFLISGWIVNFYTERCPILLLFKWEKIMHSISSKNPFPPNIIKHLTTYETMHEEFHTFSVNDHAVNILDIVGCTVSVIFNSAIVA